MSPYRTVEMPAWTVSYSLRAPFGPSHEALNVRATSGDEAVQIAKEILERNGLDAELFCLHLRSDNP